MQYNFDQIIDRSKTEATKYRMCKVNFGTDDVLPLWIADMDFQVPQPVIDAMVAKAEHGIYGYHSLTQEYKDAVASWQARRNQWTIDPKLLSTCSGIVPALVALLDMFSQEGDKILIQPPVYHQFAVVIKEEKRIVLNNPLKQEAGSYVVDFEDLEEKLQRKPKLFILCHPHNPVGKVFTREELQRIGDLCVKYEVPLICDEIHSDLVLWGKEHIPMASISAEIAANTITCFSIGKTFNMAGIQLASVYFNNQKNKKNFDAFWERLHLAMPNAFAQAGAIAAYTHGEEWLDQVKHYIEGNLEFVQAYIQKNMPQIQVSLPEATYLMWLDFSALGLEGQDLQDFIVHKAGLGLNTGESFGAAYRHFARLNVATPRSILETALEKLRTALD